MNLSIEQWLATWRELGVDNPDSSIYLTLIAHYNEKHRKYHTTQHLAECFEKFSELRQIAVYPAEIELAIWFHDSIYETLRHDNEERSADWANSCLQKYKIADQAVDRVYALILATKHKVIPHDVDAALLIDVDLSILGSSPERFQEYEKQIRQEYSYIPAFIFSTKRKKILQEFLERPRIFTSDLFFDRYERQARMNIALSLGSNLN
jgi:predicted metal-dependent HD superfamily phosphohydrolase